MLHGALNIADYVGFIKKCMKQMQKTEYKLAKKIDLEIRQLSDQEAPLTPGKQRDTVSISSYIHLLIMI